MWRKRWKATGSWGSKGCMVDHQGLDLNVDPCYMNDNITMDGEIQEAVKCLWNGWTGGLGGMHAEHLKQWLSDTKEGEREDKWGQGDFSLEDNGQ